MRPRVSPNWGVTGRRRCGGDRRGFPLFCAARRRLPPPPPLKAKHSPRCTEYRCTRRAHAAQPGGCKRRRKRQLQKAGRRAVRALQNFNSGQRWTDGGVVSPFAWAAFPNRTLLGPPGAWLGGRGPKAKASQKRRCPRRCLLAWPCAQLWDNFRAPFQGRPLSLETFLLGGALGGVHVQHWWCAGGARPGSVGSWVDGQCAEWGQAPGYMACGGFFGGATGWCAVAGTC